SCFSFSLHDAPTTYIHTLSLHDALPIFHPLNLLLKLYAEYSYLLAFIYKKRHKIINTLCRTLSLRKNYFFRFAIIKPANSSPIRSCASLVAAPMWGVSDILG